MNVADLFATLRIAPNQKSFDAADRLIEGVKTALVGLAAIAGAHVLVGMIEDTVELGSHINDLSQVAGTSAETLQVLGHVAKLNSSDMDSMAQALGKLGNNMKAAADGGEQQQKAFSKLGVQITDVEGRLRPVEDVFEDISINQKKVSNETEKGVAIFDTLGKSGRQLIPTMNDIADKGMAAISKEAHELGAVMDDEAIAALDEFGDTQDKVKAGLIGLRNQAVVAILPTLQKLADGFLEWVKANRVLIAQKLQVVLNLLIRALQMVGIAANFVLNAFEFLSKHWDIIKVSILGLAAAMVIFQAKSIAAAIASGAAWVIANIPLVLLAVLMTALILLVDDVITAFQGGNSVLAKFFQERFGIDLVDTLSRMGGAIKASFDAVIDYLTDKLNKLIAFGERVSKFIYETIHGDTQFQVDEDNTNRGTALALKQIRSVLGNNASREQVEQYGRSVNPLGGLSKDVIDAYYTTVQQPPSGIDRMSRGPSGATVQAPVNVTINGATGTPEENAKAMRSVVEDHWQEQLQFAGFGVGGVK